MPCPQALLSFAPLAVLAVAAVVAASGPLSASAGEPDSARERRREVQRRRADVAAEVDALRATNAEVAGALDAIIVTLGSTSFDGLSRTSFWVDVLGNRTGWGRTSLNTIGLVWVSGSSAVGYQRAVRAAARTANRPAEETTLAFAASLIPIVFAYTLAHYFSLLVFEGQGAVALLSDPYGRGWDLLGTTGNTIDYGVLSTATIAYVQAGAIVVGHVAVVIAAHDRAVELWPRRVAERTQYPMLAVMIAYTVGGLAILLGG